MLNEAFRGQNFHLDTILLPRKIYIYFQRMSLFMFLSCASPVNCFKTCVLVFLNNVFDVTACTNQESFVRGGPILTFFFFFFFFLVDGMERGSRYR